MDMLTLSLARVESAVPLILRGDHALRFDPSAEWAAPNRRVSTQEIDDIVNQFCREAERPIEALPHLIVEATEGQHVAITATAFLPGACDGTAVNSSWSRTGLAPHVHRLVEKILDERKHLPEDRPGLVLVDFQRWLDFRVRRPSPRRRREEGEG